MNNLHVLQGTVCVALAFWVVATHGAELGLNEQLAEVHAGAELGLSQQLTQSRAEVKWLRAELVALRAALRAKTGDAEDATVRSNKDAWQEVYDDVLDLEDDDMLENTGTAAPTLTPSEEPTSFPTHTPTWAPSTSPTQEPSQAPTLPPSVCPVFQWNPNVPPSASNNFGGGFAKDRCRGRCDLIHHAVNKDCVVPKWQIEAIMGSVVLDTEAPSDIIRWRVYRKSSWRTHPVGFDLVSCPCNKKHELTDDEALQHILGEAAAMQPDPFSARSPEFRKAVAPFFTMKVSVASFKMLNCWKAKCSAQSKTADSGLLNLLEFGGGSYC